jgi:hypothetical protein
VADLVGLSAYADYDALLADVEAVALTVAPAALGPVHELTATAGPSDVVHLVARHDSGITSCATLTALAPPAAASVEFLVWGEAGLSRMPDRDDRPDLAFAAALDELARLVETGGAARRSHPCGLEFGVHQIRLLAEAEAGMRRSEEPEGPVGIA